MKTRGDAIGQIASGVASMAKVKGADPSLISKVVSATLQSQLEHHAAIARAHRCEWPAVPDHTDHIGQL